ncbi:MAG TPA: hypothetical protein VHM20_06590 [Gammaproteobacteria bacterium]|jgi:hypothetical protein|nr:hypothetical protein [Gammaproteobacteria bacterium]
MKINAKHAENITFTDMKIEPLKITLPPGEKLDPQLMEMLSQMHQKIIEGTKKTIAEHPSATRFEIELPEGVSIPNLTSTQKTNISTTEPVESKDIVNKSDIKPVITNNVNAFFDGSIKTQEKSVSNKVADRENPCTRLRKGMCIIL